MDSAIYSVIFSRNSARMAAYTEEERGAYLRKMLDTSRQYIDEALLMAVCRFSNSNYQLVFVNRMKGGLAELMEGALALEDMQYYQHFETERYLGTLEEGAPADFSARPRYVDGQPALFKVSLLQHAPGYYQAPAGQVSELVSQRQACFDEVGAKPVFRAVSDWSDEAWRGFALEWFPSLPALQQFQQTMRSTAWGQLFQTRSTLCYGSGGSLSPNPWEKR